MMVIFGRSRSSINGMLVEMTVLAVGAELFVVAMER